MQKKKFIITLLFAVLSIFMITACSDNSNESNSGGGGTIQPEPNNPTVKKFYKFGLDHVYLDRPYLSNYALLSDGSLYAWGDNNYGQLGLGDDADEYYYFFDNQKINIPDKINELIALEDVKYDASTQTAIFKFSLYAITEDGELYVCGDNSDGRLGIGNTDNQTKPVKVTGITGKIKQLLTFMDVDRRSIYAITEDGSLYAWGNNYFGQLGVGDEVNKNRPTKVNLPSKLKELITTGDSTYAILEDGSLYAWGSNGIGQLGIGKDDDRIYTPEQVTGIDGTIKYISLHVFSTMEMAVNFLTEDGLLYGTGYTYSNYPEQIYF